MQTTVDFYPQVMEPSATAGFSHLSCYMDGLLTRSGFLEYDTGQPSLACTINKADVFLPEHLYWHVNSLEYQVEIFSPNRYRVNMGEGR